MTGMMIAIFVSIIAGRKIIATIGLLILDTLSDISAMDKINLFPNIDYSRQPRYVATKQTLAGAKASRVDIVCTPARTFARSCGSNRNVSAHELTAQGERMTQHNDSNPTTRKCRVMW